MGNHPRCSARATATLAFVLAPVLSVASTSAAAADIVGLGAELPRVHFDVPRGVVATELAETAGGRLIAVELPVSVVVAKGDVDRVAEVVVEIDGAASGLIVQDFAPVTTLTTEFASDIEVAVISESDRHLDASLGGILPNPGSGIAQLTPSISAGAAGRDTEKETVKKLAPKEAIVVAGAINRRQGVRFKFRPSSQTTLEGERRLTVTFAAPDGWAGGELAVRCSARGERRVLFVKQRKVWGSANEPVAVRLSGGSAGGSGEQVDAPSDTGLPLTAAKPVVVTDAPATLWKARKPTAAP